MKDGPGRMTENNIGIIRRLTGSKLMESEKIRYSRITFEERKQIQKWIKRGLSFNAISKIMNRSKSGIANEVNSNGGRKEYDAEKSQQMQEIKKDLRNREAYKISINQKIQNIEFQLEILTETIKALYDKQNQ